MSMHKLHRGPGTVRPRVVQVLHGGVDVDLSRDIDHVHAQVASWPRVVQVLHGVDIAVSRDMDHMHTLHRGSGASSS